MAALITVCDSLQTPFPWASDYPCSPQFLRFIKYQRNSLVLH